METGKHWHPELGWIKTHLSYSVNKKMNRISISYYELKSTLVPKYVIAIPNTFWELFPLDQYFQFVFLELFPLDQPMVNDKDNRKHKWLWCQDYRFMGLQQVTLVLTGDFIHRVWIILLWSCIFLQVTPTTGEELASLK